MAEAPFDVFISYRHADAEPAHALAAALRAQGIQVWIDAAEIDDFATITRRIADGLARSKAVVAWYSSRYPESRACQWELTAGFIAAQRSGDPRQRVLVINPEPDNRHINPVEIRDELYLVPTSPAGHVDHPALAGRIAAHVARLSGALGEASALSTPQWHPRPRFGSEWFVGRLREMWQLHSALWASSVPIITNRTGPPLVQLVGLGGSGKSLLAEEYGLRFGASYPGGVFWLDALGPGDRTPDVLTAERERQLRGFAERLLRRPVGDSSTTVVEGVLRDHFDRQGKPFLWVVDDVPRGMAAGALTEWAAPHPLGHTVLTTRSREYANLGATVGIESLDAGAAFDLLTKRRNPESDAARRDAAEIAAELGHHALAMEVASARIAFCSFAEFLSELRNPAADALELAERFADELPNGHEKSVVGTLLKSIRQLDGGARDLLSVAAIFGRAPIPMDAIVSAWVEVTGAAGGANAPGLGQLAVRNALTHSLVEPVGPGAIRIHGLVRRVMASQTSRQAKEACQRAAIRALGRTWPKWGTLMDHATVQPWVDHARSLQHARVDPLAEATLMGLTGRFDAERGDRLSALYLLKEAHDTCCSVLGKRDALTLRAATELAAVELEQGGGGIFTLNQALEDCAGALPETDSDLLNALSLLGSALADEERLADAREIQEHVLELRTQTLPPGDPLIADGLDNLANTLARQGDLARARSLAEQALAASRLARGDEHPETLTIMNNLACTLRDQEDLPGARALQERVLAGRRRLFGDESWETVRAMENLARTLEQQGDVSAARELADRAWALRRPLMNLAYPTSPAPPSPSAQAGEIPDRD